MGKTDQKFRTALDFLLEKEGRKAQSRLSKEQNRRAQGTIEPTGNWWMRVAYPAYRQNW
jgi:hypothetical protein